MNNPSSDPALDALAADYRALRASPTEVKRRGEVMDKLRAILGDGAHTRAEVIRLMGPPDEVAASGSVTLHRMKAARRPPQGSELLVYHVRGGHDVLYFDCEGEKVLGARFWHAGD